MFSLSYYSCTLHRILHCFFLSMSAWLTDEQLKAEAEVGGGP